MMSDTNTPETIPAPEPAHPARELSNHAVGTLQGENVRLMNGVAGAVIGNNEASLAGGAAGAVIAGNRLAVAGGGSGLMLAGNSIEITGGGAGMFVAGNRIEVRQGGGALLLSGNARAEQSFIGIVLAGRAELKDSRVVLNTPAALALGAALGLVLAVAGRLLRRGSK
jgi:hypothetical protein